MKIAVLGLGNVLMGDDGLGPSVVRELEALYDFPDTVTVADLGTPGLDLIPYLIDVEAAIFVDTVRATASPGDVRVYQRADILRHAPNPRVSPHDPGLKSALWSLQLAGLGPKHVALVGVVPARVIASPGLSDPVRAAIPRVLIEVVRGLACLGVVAKPKRPTRLPAPWWEEPIGVA